MSAISRSPRRRQSSRSVGCGNFGAPPKPPNCAIEAGAQVADQRGHRRRRTERPGGPPAPAACAPSAFTTSASCAAISARFSLPERGDALAKIGKRRHAVARLLRKVGAAEERRAVGREEHGQRPAAGALREHLVRALVDLVEVGPLLAVDLDVDEQAVHHRGDRRVLEALVRHDVAPVARRVADREQDRLVLAARPRRAPRRPTGTSRPGSPACCWR